MKELPNNISRSIIRFRGLNLRLVVRLKKDDGSTFHNEIKFENKDYLKLEPSAYLILELDRINNEYDPTRSVVIGSGNIHIYIKKINQLIKDIYKEKIFATQKNEIIIYSDMAKKYSQLIQVPGTNTGLALVPAIVYDENEISYEGANLYFNNTSNVIGLSIDELEALSYTLSKIDIFTYSQLLINYLSNYEKDIQPATNISKYGSKHIDWTKPNNVSANYRKPDNNDIMSSLSQIKSE